MIEFTDALVFAETGKHLSAAQRSLLQASWSRERQNYDQIADSFGYSAHYLRKHVGPQLWQLLSQIFDEKVTKLNCRMVIERQMTSPRIAAPTPPKGHHLNSHPSVWAESAGLQHDIGADSPQTIAALKHSTLEDFGSHPVAARADQGASLRSSQPEELPSATPPTVIPYCDWGEAADVDSLHGRQQELDTLSQWLTADRCRLIGLFGVGGIGKTHLGIKTARQVFGFDCIIWRSLRNAPPLTDLLADVLNSITQSPQLPLFDSSQGQLAYLIEQLRSTRCLLVLDNAETILRGGDYTGYYRDGYEEYGQLFKRVGETSHASCLLLTSREKPREFSVLEGKTSPVRSLYLKGLSVQDGWEILLDKGVQQTSELDSTNLVNRYGGNPLALKIISTTIQELFDGKIDDFMQQDTAITAELGDLLHQQFSRLSATEKTILYWLAIAREPISLKTLCDDLVAAPPHRQILDGLKSLGQRSLIETHDRFFSLQPVVMEYVSDRLIAGIGQEIIQNEGSFALLSQHVLLKAQAKDYIREIQARLVLKPLLADLLRQFKVKHNLEHHLAAILTWQKENFPLEPGYLAGNILNLLLQLGADLSGYDCSHLVIWQAYLEGANLSQVNFAHSDLSKSVLTETFASTLSVTFSPDGAYFATATTDNDICLWQTHDGKKVLVYQGHRGWVHSVAFSPTDSIIASSSEDETIRLWDIQTGQCLKTLKGHQNWVWSVAFSADGRLLASSSNDQTVRLWDVQTGMCLKVFKGHRNWVWSVAFSPDQTLLASGSNDQTIRLWNVQTGTCTKTLLEHTDWVQSVAFNPTNSTLASGSRDQTIKLWNVQTGTCTATLQGHTNWVQAVTFNQTGTLLASASNDQTLKLWDLETRSCIRTFQSSIQDIWSVAFSPDGNALISGGSDQTVQIWDVHTGQCLKTLRGHLSGILAIDNSSDGRYLVTGGSDRTVRLWDLTLGQCLKTLNGHTSWVRSVAFSPQNSAIVASGSSDHTIRLWDIFTGQCVKVLHGHDSWVRSIRFSADGSMLASGSTDHTVRLWDVETGECLHRLTGHSSWVRCVAVSSHPNQPMIASSGDDQTIRLWNSNTGSCIRILTGHTSGIWSVDFSPDGNLLASGGDDHAVKVWDVNTGECLRTLHGHSNWVQAIAFSPNGHYIASGSNDQTIHLWDALTGERLKILQSHHNRIWAVVFNRVETETTNDLMLISGSEDETIRIWNPATGECMNSLRSPRPCEGMNILGTQGLTNAQKFALIALGAVERL